MGRCKITFGAKHFDEFIHWIDENRKGLRIFDRAPT